MKGFPDNSIDLVLTDIPYGEVNRASSGLRSFDKEDADIITFDLLKVCKELDRICKQSLYIFCGIEQTSIIRSYFYGEKEYLTRHCFWIKPNPSPVNGEYAWLSATENCMFIRKPKGTFNEFCQPNYWHWKTEPQPYHPTAKPVGLFEKLIKASSNEGDLVLDCCLGSGTTAVAAKNTGRSYIGIELNPEYIAIANERLKQEKLALFT